jgi:hypothetical protein
MRQSHSTAFFAGVFLVASGVAQGAMIAESVAAFDPAGGGTVSVLPSGLTKTVASWQTDVAAAHAADFGGVWNGSSTTPLQADGPGSDHTLAGANSPVQIRYGASLGKTLIFTPPANNTARTAPFSSAVATSGTRQIFLGDVQTAAVGLGLDPVGLAAGEILSEIALALNTRDGATGAVTITASFSGGGTQSYNVAQSLTSPASLGHVFFHFQAPAGQSVTGFTYVSTTGRGNPIDDFSFRTSIIPEPATLGLLAGTLLMLARRRA